MKRLCYLSGNWIVSNDARMILPLMLRPISDRLVKVQAELRHLYPSWLLYPNCMECQLWPILPARALLPLPAPLLPLSRRLLRLTHLSQKLQPVLLQSALGLGAALRALCMAIPAEG